MGRKESNQTKNKSLKSYLLRANQEWQWLNILFTIAK